MTANVDKPANPAPRDPLPVGIWVFLVLLVGAALTSIVYHDQIQRNQSIDSEHFNHLNSQIDNAIAARLGVYRYGLLAARNGLTAYAGRISRQAWKDLVDAPRIHAEFPGALGIGYIARVPNAPEAIQHFLDETRADSAPDFTIKALPTATLPIAARWASTSVGIGGAWKPRTSPC